MDIPGGFRYRGERLPEISPEGLPFVEEFLELHRREAVLELKMRNSKLCFYESRVEPYVLWCYRAPWYCIDSMAEKTARSPWRTSRKCWTSCSTTSRSSLR